MLTVIVDFDGSGNTRMCKPFASLYSVMPSTDVTFSIPLGRTCPKLPAAHRKDRATNTIVRFIYRAPLRSPQDEASRRRVLQYFFPKNRGEHDRIRWKLNDLS